MNSRITISKIRLKKKGEYNPLIVHFQNGDVAGDNVSGFKAKLITRDEHGQKAVEVLSKDGHKYFNPMICTSNRFVAIRNKKTNKVKLVQVDFTSLINELHTKETEMHKEELSQQEKNKSLKRTFGTKKAVRAIRESEMLKVDKSLVKDQISEILTESKINETSFIGDNKDDNVITLTPPCNRDAKTVEDVYKITDCLSHEELLVLEDIAKDIILNKHDATSFTEFFTSFLKQILNSNGNHQKKVCCLLYASALITYVKAPAKSLKKISTTLCPYSEMISNKIIREFSIKTGSLINRPLAMKDKAVCYAMVLLAIANDFKIDLELLAKQSAYGFKKMKQLGRLVGLVPASKNSNVYGLSLPLPPPMNMVKSYQKKK